MEEKKPTQSIEQIGEEIKLLSAKQSIMVQKALDGDDPQALIKAKSYLEEVKKKGAPKVNPKSWMFTPPDFTDSYNGFKDTRKNGLSFDILRAMGKLFIVKDIKDTRIDQVSNFLNFTIDDQKEGFTVRRKRDLFDENKTDVNRADKNKISSIVKFLEQGGVTGKWDTFDDLYGFVRKILNDSLTYDQATFECVRNRRGELVRFQATDASFVRILNANDPRYKEQYRDLEKEWEGQKHMPRFGMVYNQQIMKNPTTGQDIIYYPWELGYGARHKSTDVWTNGYGISELESAIDLVTWILNGFQYNGNFFKQGSQPKGFLNLKSGGGDNTVLSDFRNSWRDMVTGVGNCLSGDTFIFTSKGKAFLKDFFVDNEEDKKIKVWTGKKFENALVFKSGKKRLNRITLNNGMSIDSSPDHRFKTVNNVGDIVWKKRSELKEGEYLMINKKPIPNSELIYYKGKEVESDLFEVIGWLIGDGYIGENLPKKRCGSLFYHQDYERFFQQLHSIILSKYCINNTPSETFRSEKEIEAMKKSHGFKSVSKEVIRTSIFDSDFFSFLYDLGFTSSKDGKTIPKFLSMCNPKYRRAFLKGFFSADCHVAGGRYIQMAISNDKLRQQTKELLLSEGVRCGNHEGFADNGRIKKGDGHRLLIKDNDIFFRNIGLSQIYKGFRENDFKYYSVKNSMPHELCKKEFSLIKADLKLKYKETKKRSRNQKVTNSISACLTDKEVFSFNRFKDIYDIVEKHLYKHKVDSEVLDFHFEKIIKLEDLEENVDMFDVQVFDNENQFIANGVLTHNSHKIPVFEGIDLEWTDLSSSNKDMEFHQWLEFLIVIFCSVYRIDPSEMGFNFQGQAQMFGQDGQKERLNHSKNKGLKPLLRFIEKLINKYIVSEIDEDFEFKFVGIDVEGEMAQVDLDDKKLKAGVASAEDMFEKYNGRKLDPNKDTLLNQIWQQAQQAKQFGGEESNEAVDEMTGESDEGVQNPFEEFSKGNPIASEAIKYMDDVFKSR